MLKRILLCLLLVPALFASCSAAAEFNIDAAEIILRQLQYCTHCGSALLVTRIPPGAIVRCPDCGLEQARIANQFVLTQVYQVCSLCMTPLDPQGHEPGEMIACPNCHTRQILSRDAFAGAAYSGPGWQPGFPPGSARKTLLYSPNTPDAAITPVPLPPTAAQEDDDNDIIVAVNGTARQSIPIPDLEPETTFAPHSVGEARQTQVLDVPAVSVQQFEQPAVAESSPQQRQTDTLSGRLVARVNGAPIYENEIERIVAPAQARLAASLPQEELAQKTTQLRQEILERLIDRELAVQEAKRLRHQPDVQLVRQREAQLAQLAAAGLDPHREAERDVIMADMRARAAQQTSTPGPAAIREFYKENASRWHKPRLSAISPLVIYVARQTRQDQRPAAVIAQSIMERLETGTKFDELRAAHDESGMNAQPQMLPDAAYATGITAVAGSLRKGAVFGPIMLEGMIVFGKVVDEQPAGPAPFEEVEKEIRAILESQTEENSFEQWLVSLRRKGVVELYDK